MSHTIYFADKSLIFTHRDEIIPSDNTFVMDNVSKEPIVVAKVVYLFEKYNNIALICDDIEKTRADFALHFRDVVAAGGVVEAPDDSILMIERFGRWDLPKGHLECGESLEECSLREVFEETGAKGLTLREKIGVTYHAYQKKGLWELKATHWWRMSSATRQSLTPQREEGITAVEWVEGEKIAEYTLHSFPTIRTIISLINS